MYAKRGKILLKDRTVIKMLAFDIPELADGSIAVMADGQLALHSLVLQVSRVLRGSITVRYTNAEKLYSSKCLTIF